MFKILGAIINFIITFVKMVIHTLVSIFKLVALIPSYLNYVLEWLNVLPDFLFVFIIVIPIIVAIWGLKKAVQV